MARTLLMNVGIIFILTFYGLKSVNAGKIWPDRDSTVSRTSRDLEAELIELKSLRVPFLLHQTEIIPATCIHRCRAGAIKEKLAENIHPITYKGIESTTCNGWLEKCLYVSGHQGAVGEYCTIGDRIIWTKNPENVKYGPDDTSCVIKKPPLIPSMEHKPSGDWYSCWTCVCMCTKGSEDDPHVNWAFNLQPRTSDIDNHRIVVGVRLQTKNNIIWLEIKEGQLDSADEGNWKIADGSSVSKRNIDYSPLTPQNRAIQIGQITVPTNCVVTGVRFSKKTSATLDGQQSLLRLEVQGTQVNLINHRLIPTSSTWYNSDDTERFTASGSGSIIFDDIGFTDGKELHVAPFIALSDIQSEKAQPLSGTGLITKTNGDGVKYLIPELILSSIRDEFVTTTVEPETTTVKPETTTVKPETTTVEPETTTVELETTTVKPETTTISTSAATTITTQNIDVTSTGTTSSVGIQTDRILKKKFYKVVNITCSGSPLKDDSTYDSPGLLLTPLFDEENSSAGLTIDTNTFYPTLIILVISTLRNLII